MTEHEARGMALAYVAQGYSHTHAIAEVMDAAILHEKMHGTGPLQARVTRAVQNSTRWAAEALAEAAR